MKFQTELSVEECKLALKRVLKRNPLACWYEDCFIGKVRKRSFVYCFHKAYVRNSFNKNVYGFFSSDNDKTYIKIFIMSPFLSLRLYAYMLIFISLLFLKGFDSKTYTANVFLTFFSVARFTLIFGIIAQVIPISKEKKKTLIELIQEVLKAETY